LTAKYFITQQFDLFGSVQCRLATLVMDSLPLVVTRSFIVVISNKIVPRFRVF